MKQYLFLEKLLVLPKPKGLIDFLIRRRRKLVVLKAVDKKDGGTPFLNELINQPR